MASKSKPWLYTKHLLRIRKSHNLDGAFEAFGKGSETLDLAVAKCQILVPQWTDTQAARVEGLEFISVILPVPQRRSLAKIVRSFTN